MNTIKILKLSGDITDDTKLLYASDDEGNAYQTPIFLPNVVYLWEDLGYWQHAENNKIYAKLTKNSFTYLCIN